MDKFNFHIPQDCVWPGESNSGITRIPRNLANSIISCMSACVYTWLFGSYDPFF